MHPPPTNQPRLTQKQKNRLAILRVIVDGSREGFAHLARVSPKEWSELLHWLDVSGVALYFLDCLQALGQTELLPVSVRQRLERNLADNTVRMQTMTVEAAKIKEAFYDAGVKFALLKGLSLTPDSVARPELRSQLDIDFLVAQQHVTAAQKILERRGYYLHAISGRSWEFKTHAIPSGSLRNLYRNVPSRSVELHVEFADARHKSRLAQRQLRVIEDIEIPVLSTPDLFLGQGLHLFKHVSSPYYRASHLVEFHRHLRSRREDERFWSDVETRAKETGAAIWALGVVTLLVEQLLGECAPQLFVNWTMDRLSEPVRLWVQLYGWRAAIGLTPGTKLYVLLARQLEKEGLEERKTARGLERAQQAKSEVNAELSGARGALIPMRLPPMVVRGQDGESLHTRVMRIRLQLWFLLQRVHFHVKEGARFVVESQRWKIRLKEMEDRDSSTICVTNKGMTIR